MQLLISIKVYYDQRLPRLWISIVLWIWIWWSLLSLIFFLCGCCLSSFFLFGFLLSELDPICNKILHKKIVKENWFGYKEYPSPESTFMIAPELSLLVGIMNLSEIKNYFLLIATVVWSRKHCHHSLILSFTVSLSDPQW